jgi:hypothetical protein
MDSIPSPSLFAASLQAKQKQIDQLFNPAASPARQFNLREWQEGFRNIDDDAKRVQLLFTLHLSDT